MKTVPEGLTVTDTEAKVSIKACLDNFMARLILDPQVSYSMKNIKKKHGDKVVFRLIYKLGYDGSTQKKSNVRFLCIFQSFQFHSGLKVEK